MVTSRQRPVTTSLTNACWLLLVCLFAVSIVLVSTSGGEVRNDDILSRSRQAHQQHQQQQQQQQHKTAQQQNQQQQQQHDRGGGGPPDSGSSQKASTATPSSTATAAGSGSSNRGLESRNSYAVLSQAMSQAVHHEFELYFTAHVPTPDTKPITTTKICTASQGPLTHYQPANQPASKSRSFDSFARNRIHTYTRDVYLRIYWAELLNLPPPERVSQIERLRSTSGIANRRGIQSKATTVVVGPVRYSRGE